MKINHQYKIPFKRKEDFKFKKYDDKISVIAYETPLMKEMEYVVSKLYHDINSRQAVATLHNQNFDSCLLTVQFQYVDRILYVTANYGSRANIYKKKDSEMIRYLTTYVIDELNLDPLGVDITCNVGNYHKIINNE